MHTCAQVDAAEQAGRGGRNTVFILTWAISHCFGVICGCLQHPVNITCHAVMQAKAGSGLVEGYSSVDDLVEQADGFAEVFPEHKFEIVAMLQVSRCQLAHAEGWTV